MQSCSISQSSNYIRSGFLSNLLWEIPGQCPGRPAPAGATGHMMICTCALLLFWHNAQMVLASQHNWCKPFITLMKHADKQDSYSCVKKHCMYAYITMHILLWKRWQEGGYILNYHAYLFPLCFAILLQPLPFGTYLAVNSVMPAYAVMHNSLAYLLT